ncbi:MAG: AI-2E family transporter [Rivularia sp. (in: Bacteria)]|nr:AI-2E family transporter [Rivularia sp. MS3]
MSPPKQNNEQHPLFSGAPLAVLIATILYILYQLLPVLELVALAVLLALVIRTFLVWFEKIFRVRLIALTMLVGVTIGFFLFLGFVVIPNLIQEATILSAALPKYLNSLIELSRSLHRDISFVPNLSQGLEQLKNTINSLLSYIPILLASTLDISLQAIATLILALYMAHDPNTLINGILSLVPRRYHKRVIKILQVTKVRLEGWIFGTGLAMLIVGTGATIGLWLLEVPLALSFGVLAGILEVIPYVGSIVGALLPSIVALTISPLKALFVLILFLVINQLDAHIVQPIVMAKRVNLNPVVVILAFLFMGKLLGLVGAILAVPTAAIVVSIIDNLTADSEDVIVNNTV